MEKARLKAEYKRIMNECNEVKNSASSTENTIKGREGLPTSTTNESKKRLPASTKTLNESKKKQKKKVRKQEELDWIENEKIVVARKKVDAKSEKARLKAEYKKIMNEQSCGMGSDDAKGKKSKSSEVQREMTTEDIHPRIIKERKLWRELDLKLSIRRLCLSIQLRLGRRVQ